MTIASASSGSVRPIESRSLSEQVTNEIRRSILAGALAPGQSLSLRRLADQLDVSFIPVRDALRVLEAEGLAANPPGRSATVAPLDREEFHAIYRVRRLLEPDLARRSVLQLADAELDRLYQAAAELGGAERSMDDIYDDHRAFHLALLAPAASAWNIRILLMSERASERYVRIGFGLLDPGPDRARPPPRGPPAAGRRTPQARPRDRRPRPRPAPGPQRGSRPQRPVRPWPLNSVVRRGVRAAGRSGGRSPRPRSSRRWRPGSRRPRRWRPRARSRR